ncbi:MAG TPA: SMP-30/gluconolactonase/LRE family protein [Chitinophagaceae bacterium]|nr:SMP-30/gluconolactonase/LRE family protein [Chitinophagaceae bacterium]
MRPVIITCMLCIAAITITACNNATQTNNTAKDTTPPVAVNHVEILDTEALKLIDSNALIEVLDTGHKWTEGPVYVKDGGYVLFSDIPNNSIYKWKEGAGTSLYLKPSGHTGTKIIYKEPGSNGLLLNAKGELVLCQHGDRRIAKMDASLNNPTPKFITLAGTYMGKRLNSPNDGVFAANGDLYFTDPPYGLDDRLKDTAKQLDFQGVYRLKPGGQLDLITKHLKFPNGIALSPDGKILYVSNSDSTNMLWMKYTLDDKGFIKDSSVLYAPTEHNNTDDGNPDGMKVNMQGYIFAAGPKGIWIFNPASKLIARIHIDQKTANCAFSPDGKTLFVTSSSRLLRVKLK